VRGGEDWVRGARDAMHVYQQLTSVPQFDVPKQRPDPIGHEEIKQSVFARILQRKKVRVCVRVCAA
jgi:hypothetical protein